MKHHAEGNTRSRWSHACEYTCVRGWVAQEERHNEHFSMPSKNGHSHFNLVHTAKDEISSLCILLIPCAIHEFFGTCCI